MYVYSYRHKGWHEWFLLSFKSQIILIVVIHGTWNPPDLNAPKWHQLDELNPSNFCTKLNHELEQLKLGRAVWGRVDGNEIYFGWTGANSALPSASRNAHCSLVGGEPS